MAKRTTITNLPMLLVFGFIAGFIATLVFHQFVLALLWSVGVAPFSPFQMSATTPFGVPAMFSLAFWGGIWGLIFAFIHNRFPYGAGYWVVAFLFGAIATSFVALFIVLPLKGLPMAGGGNPSLLVTAFLINGAWGVGTGLILKLLSNWFGESNDALA